MNADSVGRNIRDVLPGDFKNKYLEAVAESGKSSSPVVIEFNYTGSDGEQVFEARFISVSKYRIDVVNRNVTEARRLLNIAESMQMMNSLGYIQTLFYDQIAGERFGTQHRAKDSVQNGGNHRCRKRKKPGYNGYDKYPGG